jgi:hypothetical protein
MISIKGCGKVSMYMERDIADCELNEIVTAWRSENKNILFLLVQMIRECAQAKDTDALMWWVAVLGELSSEIGKRSAHMKRATVPFEMRR